MFETKWNQIIDAYDKQFHLLESARAEYMKHIAAIFESLKDSYQNSSNGAVDISHVIESGNAGRDVFRSSISSSGLEWCRVVGKMGSPWSDSTEYQGMFLIGIEYSPQKEYLPPSRYQKQTFVDTASTIPGWHVASRVLNIESTQNWLFLDMVELKKVTALEEIHAKYEAALQCAKEFGLRCSEMAAVVVKTRNGLKKALGIVMANGISGVEQTFQPGSENGNLPQWQGMSYIQVNFKDLLNIWIGVRPHDRDLVYGHDPDKSGFVGIAQAFAKKVSAKKTFTLGGNYPVGVLMDEEGLSAAKEEEIADTVIKTLHTFYSCLEQLRPSSPS